MAEEKKSVVQSVEAAAPSVTCKEPNCGKTVDLCPHLAQSFTILLEAGDENTRLRVRVKQLEDAMDTARPAVKWVLNHWGRTEPELSAHDKGHAQIALDALESVRVS